MPRRTPATGRDLRLIHAPDLPQIYEISRQCFDNPWSPEDFRFLWKQTRTSGMVVTDGEQILSYCLYESHSKGLYLLQMATALRHQRQGLAGSLLTRIKQKLPRQKKFFIEADVPEDALPMQLLLRKHGFLATKVHRNQFEHLDGYAFRYAIPLDDRLPGAILSADDASPFSA